MASTGMVLDGVLASEAIDSSGEILDIKGADISDLVEGKGILNWEHNGDQGSQDIVGKIIYAKKIFSEKDCDNDRELEFYHKVRLPLIYGIGRLFDGSGHPNAVALAAQIRDYLANDEPIIVGFSIEGSTLESKDKRLLRTVCRKAALTVKPCNKSCVVGVVEDPNAPKGFKQKPDDSLKLNEHPNYTRLGGSELQFNPVLDGDVLQRALAKVESVRKALEAGNYNVAPSAMTGGAALQVEDRSLHLAHLRNQARAALRDWDRKTPFREVLKHKLPEASDDFIDRFSNLVDNYTMKLRKAQESFSKCMECSKPPRYEARWAEGMARVWFCEDHWPQWEEKHQDDIDFVRKLTDARVGSKYGEAPGETLQKAEKESLNWTAGKQSWAGETKVHSAGARHGEYHVLPHQSGGFDVQYYKKGHDSLRSSAKASTLENAKELASQHHNSGEWKLYKKEGEPRKPGSRGSQAPSFKKWVESGKAETEQATIRGKPVQPNPQIKQPHFDEKAGILHTPKGSFPMYIPSRDKENKGAGEAFHNILNDPKLSKFHDYATENWAQVHKLLKEGKLPEEVIMHGVLFSQLSPNTPVPVQELMYGHLVDSMKHTGLDPRHSEFSNIRQDWLGRDNPSVFPEHGRSHFERLQEELRNKRDSKLTNRKAGDISSFMLANNKFKNMEKYHTLHQGLVELVNRHRHDARSAVQELMDHKHRAMLWNSKRNRDIDKGLPDPGEYQGPVVPGLAPKTARYTYGMMGGGNVIVPDTHMSRYLFGLEKGKDNPTISYVKDLLWNPNNSEVLNAIDRYYAKHHDAVKHTREHPRWGSEFESDEDAIFPAFWKNWVAIAPHEKFRGLSTLAHNEATDHRPFWEAIAPHLTKNEGESLDTSLPEKTAITMHSWVKEYGEVPAMMLYYRYLAPQLLEAAKRRLNKKPNPVMKFEAMTIELRKAFGDPNIFDRQGLKSPAKAVLGTPERAKAYAQEFAQKNEQNRLRNIVDSQRHSVGEYNQRPEQHKLVHGLDFNKEGRRPEAPTAQSEMSHWRKAPTGSWAFVKGSSIIHRSAYTPAGGGKALTEPHEAFNEARREGLFHNLAHNVFKLGNYLPTVSVVHHPDSGDELAVIEKIKGGEHYHDSPQHRAMLQQLGDSGELDKLMAQDLILGVPDRHDHNWMVTPKGMKVLDHGYAFEDPGNIPDYIERYSFLGRDFKSMKPHELTELARNWTGAPVHDSARQFIRDIDEDALRHEMVRHQAPQHIIEQTMERLRKAKEINDDEKFKHGLPRMKLWNSHAYRGPEDY